MIIVTSNGSRFKGVKHLENIILLLETRRSNGRSVESRFNVPWGLKRDASILIGLTTSQKKSYNLSKFKTRLRGLITSIPLLLKCEGSLIL